MSVEFAMRTDRAAWLRTTALAGWLLSASVPAFAQALPTPGDAIRNTASGGDIAIIANPTPATLQVDLRARNTVIEWAGFSVPEGSTATFRDGRADGIAGTNPIAVLNRVVATPAPTPTPSPNFSESFSTFAAPAAAAAAPGSAPAISQILGALNSDPNVSVFLINPTGILFGPNANVSVGALVASTLALSDTEFFGTDGFDFTGGSGSIQVDAGARITAASTLTTGAVALIAAAIDTRGTLSASGDVAIVSASDVNLVFQPGSPLSLTIQRGTALNAPMVARGTIAGRNVLFAAATQATVTESILDIQSLVTATTATASDRGVILAAGPTSVPGGRVAFAAGPATGGVVDVTLGGSLNASGAAGDVTLLTNGAIGAPGNAVAIDAGGNVTVRPSRGTTQLGSIAAGGDVSIVVPGALEIATVAGNDVAIVAGSIAGAGGGPGTDITGRGAVDLDLAGSATLGAVDGTTTVIITAPGGDVRTTRLQSAGTIEAVARTLDLGTIGGSDALLTAQVGDLVIAGGTVTDAVLSAANDLRITGTLTSNGTTTLIAGDAIVGGSVVGTGSLSAFATTIDATELSGAAGLSTNSASLTLDRASATAGSGSLVTTDGALAIGSGQFARLSLDSAADLIIGNTIIVDADARLVAAGAIDGGGVRSGTTLDIAAGGRIDADELAGASAVTITGDAVVADVLESTNGTVRATALGGGLAIGSAVAGGNLALEAAAGVTLRGNATAGGDLTLRGSDVTLGNEGVAIQQAGGQVRVDTTAGAIRGVGSLTLRSNADGVVGEPVRLNAATRIDFAATTAIESGGRAGDLLLQRGDAGAALALGAVSVRRIGDGTLVNGGDIVFGGPVVLTDGLTLTSTAGAVRLGNVTITGPAGLTINAADAIGIGGIAARDLFLRGASVNGGTLDIANDADIAASNGALLLAGGRVGNQLRLAKAGTTGSLTIAGALQAAAAPGSTADAIVTSTTDARIDTLRSVGGNVEVTAGGAVTGAAAGRGATLRANAATGSLRVTAGGALTLAGFDAGRDVALTTTQALSVTGDVTLGGSLTLSGATVALGGGTKSAAGAIDITALSGGISADAGARLIADSDGAGGGDMTLRSAAAIALGGTTLLGGPARQSNIRLALGPGAPLTLGTVAARSLTSLNASGGAAGLDTTGTVTIDTLSLVDGFAVGRTQQPAALTIGTLTSSAGGVSLSSPQLRVGSVTAAGDVTIETAGELRFDAIRAPGRLVSIGSSDIAIGQAITASEVRLINRGTANRVRIGGVPEGNAAEFNAAAAPLYALTNEEIARIDAATLRVDAGGRDLIVGDATFGATAGSAAVSLWNRGRIDVLGRLEVTGGASARTLQLGGDGTDTGIASVIRVAPRPSGGGRIVAEGGRVLLAGGRIGVGYDRDFQMLLGLAPGSTATPTTQEVNDQLVARSNSSLYIATLAGEAPYVDTVLVRAGTLAVRYADFALFQNTGLPGLTSGIDLTGLSGVTTLQIGATAGVTPNSFAFFGAINGVSGRATSLLGAESISLDSLVDRGGARANGCLIGSAGGGCLSASLAQPQLLRVENNTEIFGSSAALTLLFDPLVGSNNESLFADIVGLDIAPGGATAEPAPPPECPPGSQACPAEPQP
ncbi:filamentous hemagglutinin N-terminal domain-containing protein [Sphingomonas sp. SFZ2018-12]|uniref:beta strand repeat-containing protein n=1 Tax=Sphingomonas sp. SFZ2018-12 TaxID=2683197 RepID=UPI001F0D5F26|nr:filamentous hemagglutinin N-terminal domain-containing protein [Sphingomonas sp. SFZ2018-12]